MKLTDLRAELTARANTTDETPDLLAGVQHKIAQTKRRRKAGAAGVVGGVAAIAAFAFGILPSLTTSTPQPADDVPKDYTKDGMILHGLEGQDSLEQGWIGDRGQQTLDFSWTPLQRQTRFAGYCNTSADGQHFTVSINNYVVGTSQCVVEPDAAGNGISVPADSALWLAAPAGKPARVVVQLTDANGTPRPDQETQVALGIYRVGETAPDGPPTQTPPTSGDDYVKDGIRYRAKIGGDSLVAAKIADRGTSDLVFTFKNPGGGLSLSSFCSATSPGNEPQYQLVVKVNLQEVSTGGCTGETTDAGTGFGRSLSVGPQPGQEVEVSIQLQDKNGRRVKDSDDWIGAGIYAKGAQRAFDTTRLDEIVEYGGRNYRLSSITSPSLTDTLQATIATPADTPFLVAVGSTSLYDGKSTVRLSGLSHESNNSAGGIGTIGEAARPAGSVTATFQGATKDLGGVLILAVYLPD